MGYLMVELNVSLFYLPSTGTTFIKNIMPTVGKHRQIEIHNFHSIQFTLKLCTSSHLSSDVQYLLLSLIPSHCIARAPAHMAIFSDN